MVFSDLFKINLTQLIEKTWFLREKVNTLTITLVAVIIVVLSLTVSTNTVAGIMAIPQVILPTVAVQVIPASSVL